MISLPPNIRIGLPPAAKRAKRKKDAERRAAQVAWHNHLSQSCGVHPIQVEKERQFIKDFGLTNVEVNNDGRIKFNTRQGMKQYAKARGWANMDETS